MNTVYLQMQKTVGDATYDIFGTCFVDDITSAFSESILQQHQCISTLPRFFVAKKVIFLETSRNYT